MIPERYQLGDFIRGRFLFLEEVSRKRGVSPENLKRDILRVAIEEAENEEQADFIRNRLLQGTILPTSHLPEWLDRVLWKGIIRVLEGRDGPTWTDSSDRPCLPFEAGRFNAHRQAESVFHILFENKTPEQWLEHSFPIIYRKCYGSEAGESLHMESEGRHSYRLSLQNSDLGKGSPMDCSSIMGYLFGGLEVCRAQKIRVTHPGCSFSETRSTPLCIYMIRWEASSYREKGHSKPG